MAATMTKHEALELERERAIVEVDAIARDNGHKPHPWAFGDDVSAHTACRLCGATAAVRVRVSGKEVSAWKGGHLRFTMCTSNRS